MDAIEIFFAAYGLLLALAVAKLFSSAALIFRKRAQIRIGWATPLLMLLLVLDLCSLINNGSRLLGLADLSLKLVANSILAGGVYYLIATLAAPDDVVEWPDLDAYYDRHKTVVVGGMMLGSMLGFELTSVLVRGFVDTLQARWMGLNATLLLTFYLLMIVLLFIRNRAVNLVILAILNAIFLVVMLTF